MKQYTSYAVETSNAYERYDYYRDANQVYKNRVADKTPCRLYGIANGVCTTLLEYYGERPVLSEEAKTIIRNHWNEVTTKMINDIGNAGEMPQLVKELDSAIRYLGLIEL